MIDDHRSITFSHCALSQLSTHVGDEKLNELPSIIRSVNYVTAGSERDITVAPKLNPNAERIRQLLLLKTYVDLAVHHIILSTVRLNPSVLP